jgi:hypothetical protein
MPRLLSIKPSRSTTKKLTAIFRLNNGRTRKIHFGAKGYSNFTIHKDKARRQRYIERHSSRENFYNPMTAGALSRWILWNKPSKNGSIRDYKRRFGL